MDRGTDGIGEDGATAWRGVSVDVARCIRFYSRLPVPPLPFETDLHAAPEFGRIARVVPLAGLFIAAGPAILLTAALFADLGSWLAAALAIAGLTLVTGAFHEDGLADTADGFAGGATRERRLAIMRDSLIGSYGGTALALAFALRIGALATLCDRVPAVSAAIVFCILATLSRTAGLVPLVLLPPARADGASASVGRPGIDSLWVAGALAAFLAAAGGLAAGLSPLGIVLMLLFAAGAALALTRLSAHLIGGQTGDVAGAAQQISEIVALVGLLVTIEP
jgi:adenosylcobinamide-GDP ribazoletransferase